MKRILTLAGLLVFSLVFASGAYAVVAATGQLQVSATVVAVCTVSTTSVNFGNVTGVSTPSANGDVTVNCPSGTPYWIALDAGMHFGIVNGNARHVSDGPFPVPYFLLQDAGLNVEWGDSDFANTYAGGTSLSDVGTGSVQPHTVYGLLNSFGGIPAGTVLTDTVTVAVHY